MPGLALCVSAWTTRRRAFGVGTSATIRDEEGSAHDADELIGTLPDVRHQCGTVTRRRGVEQLQRSDDQMKRGTDLSAPRAQDLACVRSSQVSGFASRWNAHGLPSLFHADGD